MSEDKKDEGNVWVKRFGLIILIIGMFPDVVFTYPDESMLIIKWVVIFAAITYGISMLKYLLGGFFK